MVCSSNSLWWWSSLVLVLGSRDDAAKTWLDLDTNQAISIAGEPHVFVHLTDPQLGMKNMYGQHPEDFEDEKQMFEELAGEALKLKPKFVFLGGDMQNFWPNEKGLGRNTNNNKNITDMDLDVKQRASVKNVKDNIEKSKIPVVCTAGNHDIGDVPDAQTITNYGKWWNDGKMCGKLYNVVDMKEPRILYLQITSQLYYNSTQKEAAEAKTLQNSWLKETLAKNVTESTKLIVVLTHIPPFMRVPDEPSGWANWKQDDRDTVLGMLGGRGVPVLWVCGHFHANVVNDVKLDKLDMKIRVTSAAGTTMYWGNKADLSPREAQIVASKDIATAFKDDIGFANIADRMQAIPKRSGMRIFKVYDDGTVKDKWFTLAELKEGASHSFLALSES